VISQCFARCSRVHSWMLTHTVASVCHLPPPCSACLMINANQELEMGFRNNIRWIPKGSRQFEFCWGFGQAWSMMRSEGTAGWDLMRSCTSLRKARCSIVRETGVWELDWNWTLCVCVCVRERERERERERRCSCASFGTVEDSTHEQWLNAQGFYCEIWCVAMGSHTPSWLLIFSISICLCYFP